MDRTSSDHLSRDFLFLLIQDVIATERRFTVEDSQSHRRDLIRVQFAAIEGAVWLMREHVHATSKDTGYLTSLADLALRQRSFEIAANGHVKELVKFTPLPAAIKLIVQQARLVAPELRVDFGHAGWQALGRAIERRNRVTHPKSTADLQIGNVDVADARAALSWTLATTEYILGAMTRSFAAFIREMGALLEELKSGNPAALAEYQRALESAAEE